MTDLIDGIIHIADVPALVAWFASNDPGKLSEDGSAIIGFARTPTVINGAAALTYVRVTGAEAAAFETAMPGVTVLASAPYTGRHTPDVVYDTLFADPDAMVLYDAVYDRSPQPLEDGTTYTPPARFGQMA